MVHLCGTEDMARCLSRKYYLYVYAIALRLFGLQLAPFSVGDCGVYGVNLRV